MKLIIVGQNNGLLNVAKSLAAKGYTVTIIDKCVGELENINTNNNIQIVYGDATKAKILEYAGIKEADIIIALTPKDAENLAICQSAMLDYSIKNTISLVNDYSNIEVFKAMGVTNVINTTENIEKFIQKH